MAHPNGADDDGDGYESDSNESLPADGEESSGIVDRRSVLKAAGVAAVGGIVGIGTVSAASAPSGVDVSQADGYEVWTVQQGETVVLDLGDGDVLENVLIDQTASGANFYVVAANNPSGWAVRNVAWKGIGYVSDIDGWGGVFHMVLSGDGLVENVYIDNRTSGEGTEIGGGFCPRHHSGTIEVRNTFIAGCGNNAFYGSGPGKTGGGAGAVRFYNCYHRDNTVSQYRIAGPGSLVQNCVGVVDDPDGERGPYPGTTSQRARGVWCRNMPDNTVRDSVMYVSPEDCDPWASYMVEHFHKSIGDEAVLHLEDAVGNADAPDLMYSRSRDGPARFVGDVDTSGVTVGVIGDGGVPTGPAMAARGDREIPPELPGADSGTDDDTDSLSHTLTIDGSNAGYTDYSVTVDGDLEATDSIGTGDEIDGGTATGFVNGGSDTYEFAGEITELTRDGDATILVDGQEVSPEDFADEQLRTLTIDGSNAEYTDYSVTVDGDLQATDSIGAGDEIDGGTATGFVNGGSDTYRFSGEVTDLSRDGDAAFLVDGQEVSPEDFADEQLRTLTIDGSNAGYTDYSVTVDGDLEATDSIGTGDEIDGGTATGFVNGGSDTYEFAGEITELTRDGDATILVDGQEVSPEDFADEQLRTLTIDGSNAGYTDYSVTVDGDLEATDSIGVGDEIDGGTATGFVNGGSDTYQFTGAVTDLSRDGDAAILVDGQAVSPEEFADEPELPNTIAFDGDDEAADSYSFAVSGELAYDPEASDGSPEVTVEGASASGTVAGGRAAFRYSGDLMSLNVTGAISIQIDDVDG